MKRLDPNPEIVSALKDIILSTKSNWWGAPSCGFSEEMVDETGPSVDEVFKGNAPSIGLNEIEGVQQKLDEIAERHGFTRNTNAMVYPPHSFMQWHTNSDEEGERTYFVFTVRSGKFVYIDPDTGERKEDYDAVGWTQRVFNVDAKKPLWHCVWADGMRFSFGFNKAKEA